jgi:hypothetical protein
MHGYVGGAAPGNRSAQKVDCVASELCEWNHTGLNGEGGPMGCTRKDGSGGGSPPGAFAHAQLTN